MKAIKILFLSFCMSLPVFSPSTCMADWILYDDFSTNSLNATKWEMGTAHQDVTWEVSNGKLTITKVAGTLDVDKTCNIKLADMPSGANGIKLNITKDYINDGSAALEAKFESQSGEFDFGSGNVNIYTVPRVKISNNSLTDSNIYSLLALTIEDVNDDSYYRDLNSLYTYHNDSESSDELTVYLVNNANRTCGSVVSAATNKESKYCVAMNNTDNVSSIYSKIRIKQADASATFKFEIDNVYIHTGTFDDQSTEVKCAVIPIF